MQSSDLRAPTIPSGASGDRSRDPAARGVLLMVVGSGQFATHLMNPDRDVTIGRDPSCDVPLVHRKISRRHLLARACTEPLGVALEDLGSTNAAIANGARLEPGTATVVRAGDSFRVGPFTILVVEAAPREAGAAGDAATRIAITDPTRGGVSTAVERFAASSINILIQGETGTGKEVLARTLHELSGRTGPFLGINTAALSEALLESELFGHERGAFTGAARAKPGLLEAARGGTVFLDEIGEMPAPLQAKLLRALEAREIYRVGGLRPIPLDVRFLAATHRDLDAEVTAGRFRRDLLYRLDGVTLELAPLRDRRTAIPDLAQQFLSEAAATAGRAAPRLGVDAVAKLVRYAWPGNVRELRAVIERALLLCDGDELRAGAILVDVEVPPDSPEAFGELARRHRGNVTEIARALATSRSQVHRLARRFGVALDRMREP